MVPNGFARYPMIKHDVTIYWFESSMPRCRLWIRVFDNSFTTTSNSSLHALECSILFFMRPFNRTSPPERYSYPEVHQTLKGAGIPYEWAWEHEVATLRRCYVSLFRCLLLTVMVTAIGHGWSAVGARGPGIGAYRRSSHPDGSLALSQTQMSLSVFCFKKSIIYVNLSCGKGSFLCLLLNNYLFDEVRQTLGGG